MNNSNKFTIDYIFDGLSNSSVDIIYSHVNYLNSNKIVNNYVKKSWRIMCDQAISNGRRCFNSLGYSIDDLDYRNHKLTIRLSDTSYKQYITTFKNSDLIRKHLNTQFPKLLSLFGVLVSADNYLVLGENSNLTRSANQLSLPGGTVQTTSRLDSNYLFNEFKREVSEETGLPIEFITKTKLIAIATKDNTNNTPRLVFLAHTNLKRVSIKKHFNKADKEFSNLAFVKNNLKEIKTIEKDPLSNWTIGVLSQVIKSKSDNSVFVV